MTIPALMWRPDRPVTNPVIRHVDDVDAIQCPCGESTRLVTAAEDSPVGLHVTRIEDGREHFHEVTGEVYYIIEGDGTIELDGRPTDVRPGSAVFIPAGVAHRGWGGFTAVIVSSPPFDPDDEIVTSPPDTT
jgi:mannose-6-phosphate isomerase-like protein (cupin superfamily)